MTAPRCFALRRLAPFRGLTQVVQAEQARAFSHDGEVWQIQVTQARRVPGGGPREAAPSAPAFLNTAIWTRRQGLRALPLDPMFEVSTVRRLRSVAESLAEILASRVADLPFAQVDRLELWLLESGCDRLLALLDARIDDAAVPGLPSRPDWVPADPAQAPVRDLLRERAGPARAAWIIRDDAGGGRLRAGPAGTRDRFAAADFPPLLIREQWAQPGQAERVAEYLRASAPLLLLLQGLAPAVRARVEGWAAEQALAVARWHHLYPQIADPRAINRALVEAELRRAAQRSGGAP